MSVWEIVSGVLLLLGCVVIIVTVLSQESKGQGLSSVITGGGDMFNDGSRTRGREARQVRFTRIAAVVFFVLTILVNLVSLLSTK